MANPLLPAERHTSRWQLIRELLVFSAKAAIEALRDVVLIPLALIAGLVGVLTGRDHPERLFHQMLRQGRRFDVWLNLFGDAEKDEAHGPSETVDTWFDRVEAIVVEQHARGGITAGAKDAIDRTLDRVSGSRATQERGRRGKEKP